MSTKTKSGVNVRMSIVHEQQIIQNTSVSDDNDLINEKYKIKNNTMIMKKMCDMKDGFKLCFINGYIQDHQEGSNMINNKSVSKSNFLWNIVINFVNKQLRCLWKRNLILIEDNQCEEQWN